MNQKVQCMRQILTLLSTLILNIYHYSILNIQHAHKPSVLCFMLDIKLSPCPLQQLHQLLATFDDSMNKLSPAAVCLIVSIRVAAALHTKHGAPESHLTEQDPLPKCLVSIFLNLLPSKISIAFHQ